MSDEYIEVEEQGWLSRIGGSIKSVLVGILLFLISFPVLWWNEGRAVQTARSLETGAAAVVSVSADTVDTANDGKLIHLTGTAKSNEPVTDAQFGVSAQGLKLNRTVEMFQWVEKSKTETKKKLGGKKVKTTTYRYDTKWSSRAVDSSGFKNNPDGKYNNPAMPYQGERFTAGKVTLGAFTLSDSLVNRISKSEAVPLNDSVLKTLPSDLKKQAQISSGAIYVGKNPGSPQVGDLKISFKRTSNAPVSIVAQQNGPNLGPYQIPDGDSIQMLSMGTVPAAQMFKSAQEGNKFLTWILRVVGFLMMMFGVSMVFRPLTVVADVVPLFGDLLEFGFMIVAFLVAAPLSLITIAIAWIFYRPLIGIPLLLLAIGLIVAGVVLSKKRKAGAPA